MAAIGSATITEETHGSVKLIKWDWIGGTAESAITGGTTSASFNGKLIYCVTDPGTGDAPAADYDVTILDKNDIDVLAGAGIDRHTSNTEFILDAALGVVANSQLELVVQNTGSSGTANGVVYLFIR